MDAIQAAAIVVRCTARLSPWPLLFNLYTAVVESHGHKLHQYADDCQVYVSISVTEAMAAVD